MNKMPADSENHQLSNGQLWHVSGVGHDPPLSHSKLHLTGVLFPHRIGLRERLGNLLDL